MGKNKLLQDRDTIQTLISEIDAGICIANAGGEILYWNAWLAGLLGCSLTDARHIRDFKELGRMQDVLVSQQPVRADIQHFTSADAEIIMDIYPVHIGAESTGAIAYMQKTATVLSAARDVEYFRSLRAYMLMNFPGKDGLSPAFAAIAGESPAFVNTLQLAARVAVTDASVAISGESGVGKEGIAEAIHYSSPRARKPLIKINCAAIPEALLESELFGYDHGAFTGAKSGGKIGKFEQANNGTIFLDEIGDMPLQMQVKLLRVLQEKEIERVGGSKRIPLDFRIITATNQDLYQLVQSGAFREDLYYRLHVVSLQVPPLRDRREDITLLANIFLNEMCRKYNKSMYFSAECLSMLNAYQWPGNVRELKNCVEQVVVLCPSDVILSTHLPVKIQKAGGDSRPVSARPGSMRLQDLISNVERDAILAALEACNNNKSQAMEMLGISRRGFYQKLERYHIQV